MPASEKVRSSLPAAAAAAAVVLLVVLLSVGAGGGLLPFTGTPAGDDPPSAVLDDADRAALDADPVRRGTDAPPRDPAVPLHDPAAVVRAYLEAAYAVTAADDGATHRRAAAYAEPGSAPAVVGMIVLDAPPPGAERSAVVVEVDGIAANDDDSRRGYRAVVETGTGPPGGPVITEFLTADVVVARQPDGSWLVAAESAENPDLLVGEH